MDFHAYWDQRNAQNTEERYQAGLERARSGEGILASAIGQANVQEDLDKLKGLARGGKAKARRPYLVGEKGPELMVPDQNGTIIPNHKLPKSLRAVARARGGRVFAGGEPDDEVRGTGTLTHYRPTGGWRIGPGAGGGPGTDGGNLRAVAEAAELGSSESYKGGAGAPESIGVIRGLRQAFAPQRQEGKQFIEGEYSTPLRAAQAYNRAGDVGEYDPVGGPQLRLTADLDRKNPDKVALADSMRQGQYGKLLNDRLLRDYGVASKGEDGQETLTLPTEIKRLAMGHLPGSAEDVEAIAKKIAPEASKWKSVGAWNDPKTGMAMRRNLLATTTDPAEQKRIKEEQVTPKNMAWFEGRGRLTAPSKAAPEEQGLSLRDQAAIIGEHLTPVWMKPVKGVNY
jgi:hypothetical protein